MVPVAIARKLRREGFDVDAAAEHPSLRGLSDADQLARAAAEGRALVTFDVGDFLPLAAHRSGSGEGQAGLVLLRSDRFPQGQPDKIVASLEKFLALPAPSAGFVHWLE